MIMDHHETPSSPPGYAGTAAIRLILALTLVAVATVLARPAAAQPIGPSWADLADLADAADLVVRVEVKKQAELEPERMRGVAPGHTRLYIEAETIALIAGAVPLGESLRYLVDVPLTDRGKAPKLKKSQALLFARAVPSRPGEVQLVARDAQFAWSPALEERVRPILVQLAAADAPPPVTGIRDALASEGNLSGESETQIFIATSTGDPVSISVVRRPGMRPVWGVSYSEIVDQAVRPPRPQSLGWYRLACFLPRDLPGSANLATDPTGRAMAARDYAFVIDQLGACGRTRSPPPAR